MTKHTPGPWELPHFVTAKDDKSCRCKSIVEQTYAGGICSVNLHNGIDSISEGGNDAPPLEEAKANARLIAAAPEMLEALRKAYWMLTRDYIDEQKMQVVDLVDATINKATGESHE